MIPRYRDPIIEVESTDAAKLGRWQRVELAAVEAAEQQGVIPAGTSQQMHALLANQPFDIEFWLAKDAKLHHDYGAHVAERRRYLPAELARYYHGQGLTSYDGVDNGTVLQLRAFVARFETLLVPVETQLERLAREFRFLPMLERTHGQGAEIESAGYRFLRWLAEYRLVTRPKLTVAAANLRYGKLSGTIGNNSTISPALEALALGKLGLERYPGASQILPRTLWIGIAEAVVSIVQAFETAALTLWLSARSGLPTMLEGFTGTQIPSSAMPWKRNPIRCEQLRGLAAACLGYELMLKQVVSSLEGRIIDQSCVERFAWPDLFHIATWAAKVMTTILADLEIRPDFIFEEIARLRGCFASNQAKELLAELSLQQHETALTPEEAYRIVQLASWLAFEPDPSQLAFRTCRPTMREAGQASYDTYADHTTAGEGANLRILLLQGNLRPVDGLAIGPEQADVWNQKLRLIFENRANRHLFNRLFQVTAGMQHEDDAYQQLLTPDPAPAPAG